MINLLQLRRKSCTYTFILKSILLEAFRWGSNNICSLDFPRYSSTIYWVTFSVCSDLKWLFYDALNFLIYLDLFTESELAMCFWSISPFKFCYFNFLFKIISTLHYSLLFGTKGLASNIHYTNFSTLPTHLFTYPSEIDKLKENFLFQKKVCGFWIE